jgi:soluble lytic murein transglycosylase-like protein
VGKARAVLGIVFVGTLLAFSLAGAVYTARFAKTVPTPEAPALPEPGRPSPKPYILPMQYAEWVIRYCDETGVPVWLACRLFNWESGWRAQRVSPENENGTRDLGLAALNNAYLVFFERYNGGQKVDPFDPECAVRVGIRYLAALHASTGNWRAAVGAYNCGLARWRRGDPPARTRRHVKEVLGE